MMAGRNGGLIGGLKRFGWLIGMLSRPEKALKPFLPVNFKTVPSKGRF